MIRYGIEERKIVVVGECAMDLVYNRISSVKEISRDKTRILFVTASLVEHGVWTPNMRDKLVTGTVKAITENFPDAEFKIKIHPGEPLQHYRNLAGSIDPKIEVIEIGDLSSLLQNSDIIIGIGASTAMFDALLLEKPIFILNLYGEQRTNFLITENLAKECKSVDELIEGIKQSNFLKPDTANLQVFMEEQFYKFDGNCSKRAAEAILRLIVDKDDDTSRMLTK